MRLSILAIFTLLCTAHALPFDGLLDSTAEAISSYVSVPRRTVLDKSTIPQLDLESYQSLDVDHIGSIAEGTIGRLPSLPDLILDTVDQKTGLASYVGTIIRPRRRLPYPMQRLAEEQGKMK